MPVTQSGIFSILTFNNKIGQKTLFRGRNVPSNERKLKGNSFSNKPV